MNDFEAELRARLAARARDAEPVADPAVLGERIEHATALRKRAMVVTTGSIAGLMVVVVLGAVAFGQQNAPMKAVAVQPPVTDASDASPSTARTVATTPEPDETATTETTGSVPACFQCVLPGSGTETSTTVPERQLSPEELEIQQLFVMLFDYNTSDGQRLALVDDSSDLAPVMAALRQHPGYSLLQSLHVSLAGFSAYSTSSGQAKLYFTAPGSDPLTLYGYVIKVGGSWQATRQSFCDGVAEFSRLGGGPVETCSDILNPPPPPPPTTTIPIAPVTTTTLARAA